MSMSWSADSEVVHQVERALESGRRRTVLLLVAQVTFAGRVRVVAGLLQQAWERGDPVREVRLVAGHVDLDRPRCIHAAHAGDVVVVAARTACRLYARSALVFCRTSTVRWMSVTTTAAELRISDRSASFDRLMDGPGPGMCVAFGSRGMSARLRGAARSAVGQRIHGGSARCTHRVRPACPKAADPVCGSRDVIILQVERYRRSCSNYRWQTSVISTSTFLPFEATPVSVRESAPFAVLVRVAVPGSPYCGSFARTTYSGGLPV